MTYKVVALAGGVGGAKLAHGLYQTLLNGDLTVIVNTGDDFTINGLDISPDIDTVCYTLAGIANPETGWGIKDDTHQALDQIRNLGGDDWFSLGDRDIGTHLARTQAYINGIGLSEITKQFCLNMGITAHVIPMSDEPVHTKVQIEGGTWLDFQEYFVHQKCQPKVTEFKFNGIQQARPAPGALKAIKEADLVVICPSNPWVSIDPILAIQQIRLAVSDKCVVAVSPLIGGRAIKGPLAKMYTELRMTPSCLTIASHYQDLLTGIVIDKSDHAETGPIEAFGIITKTTDILMKNPSDRKRLADEILVFGKTLNKSI
jgi:LPPG:FO 2-phospho-L-lactate transferase